MRARLQQVRVGGQGLLGDLEIPAEPCGLVLFAHGSGSSRLSVRNRRVAATLHRQHLGTLLFDLLTEAEGADRSKVFDIELLAGRLELALDWVAQQSELSAMRIGIFGASTGAAAALVAAAMRPDGVGAVVSRGGRPDLAADHLARVVAPTLLIVGGADSEVLELNRRALRLLTCNRRLEVVPGATHLFQEPGTLGTVAELAAAWFEIHLAKGRRQ